MVLQIEIPILIIALGLILIAFPFIGRLLYVFKNRLGRLLSVYFIGVAGFFALNMILSETPLNISYTGEIFSSLKGVKFVYILSLILYFFGGFGLFGSISEKSVEVLEEVDLLSTLERRKSWIKQYFMYLLYGYVFLFSVYALSRILLIVLGVSPKFAWQDQLYTALGFESVLLVLVGASLFLLKCFNFGIFSREYWKSLSVEESEDNAWRIFRKLIIIFIFVWALYITFILFFVQIFQLETSLFTADILTYGEAEPIVHSLKLIFYITTVFQTIYFFSHMFKLVSSLKSVDPNFKKKVDDTIIIDDDHDDDDIKF
ncbi:MAG: hypothetical protein EU530_11285 [Promethearchaeota archaeon]|nr:MAG: hypothetical protein EU530_11285 [Candidatus Lokiarchaeota archaeon]